MSEIKTAYNVTISDTPHYVLFATDKNHPAAVDAREQEASIYNYDDYYRVATHRSAKIREYLKQLLNESRDEYLNKKKEN
jgi:hypothetical protein